MQGYEDKIEQEVQDKLNARSSKDVFQDRANCRGAAANKYAAAVEMQVGKAQDTKYKGIAEGVNSGIDAAAGVASFIPGSGLVASAAKWLVGKTGDKADAKANEERYHEVVRITGTEEGREGHLGTVVGELANSYGTALDALASDAEGRQLHKDGKPLQNKDGSPRIGFEFGKDAVSALAQRVTDQMTELAFKNEFKGLEGRDLREAMAIKSEEIFKKEYVAMCEELGIPAERAIENLQKQQEQSQEQQQSHDMSRIPPGLLAKHGKGFTSCAQEANQGQHYSSGSQQRSTDMGRH